MKLQISFDCIELEKALDVADSIFKYADIIEVGTSLILEYGVKSVEKFSNTNICSNKQYISLCQKILFSFKIRVIHFFK